MSPSLDTAQSQWLAQLASMRAAIAELKLNQANGNVQEYGHDIVLDDDDDLTGGSGSDGIWDIMSDKEEDEYSSDYLDGPEEDVTHSDVDRSKFDQAWLRAKCTSFASRKSGLDKDELQDQILALLAADSKGILTHQPSECRSY